MSTKRPTYTVYCETCQKQFATYVLGRGYAKLSRKQAISKGLEHEREQPSHKTLVSERA